MHALYSSAKTCALGHFHITHPDQKTRSYSSMSGVIQQTIGPNDDVEQDDLTTEYIVSNLVLSKYLGKGSFGTAYLASLSVNGSDKRDVVVKFSNELLKSNILTIENNSIKMNYELSGRDKDSWNKGKRDIQIEYENAVSILAPYYFNNPVGRLKHDNDKFRLERIKGNDFIAIQKEALRLRHYPGYHHIHKILHYDENLLCIFSEYCHGSLQEQIAKNMKYFSSGLEEDDERMHLEIPTSRAFLLLSTQMAQAVHYLLYVVQIAHLDIKPDNILYQVQAGQDITWKLSDFGLCEKIDRETQFKTRNIKGTRVFTPPSLWIKKSNSESRPFNGAKDMIFQYAVTMLEAAVCSSSPQTKFDPTPYENDQYFYDAIRPKINQYSSMSQSEHPVTQLEKYYPFLKQTLDIATNPPIPDYYYDFTDYSLLQSFVQHLQHGEQKLRS